MLRILFSMLRDSAPYQDPKIDYQAIQAQKRAPRYIRQLKLMGCWPKPALATK
jgi:hypothetical protein